MAGQEKPFNSDLLACCDDCGICCNGWCCLPCQYGYNVDKIRGGGCCFPCLLYSFCSPFACCFAGSTRTELRAKYNLKSGPCNDCCVHIPCCCGSCATCQEARELKYQQVAGPAQAIVGHGQTSAPYQQHMR